jgi:long-chain acyl-CoA synthetase
MSNSLVQFLSESVARTPDAEAIVHGDRRVTYAELWSTVGKLAALFEKHSLERGARVAILLENCPEYVASYYGALAAGGAAIGLNTAARARDLLNWIRHSGASWVIAHTKHKELKAVAEGLGPEVKLLVLGETSRLRDVTIHATWQEMLDLSPAPIAPERIEGSDLAAIIYTSGTTGNPKGVSLSHQNLAANTTSILQYLNLTADDRIVNVLPFYYSYGNSILHTHLAVGGTVILENSLAFLHKVVERLVSERSTGFSGVPSTFALLLARTDLGAYDLSSLRYLTQAGGPMPPANQERLKKVLPHTQIFIMYGQTEATARLTYLPPERLEEKLGSCGIPIPGVKIEIRDENGAPLPPHRTGEICAAGDNIMMGYWRAQEMTDQVVKDNWLHTGDLAHFDEDGFIYIDGRSSEMIKSGGQRISPKEIEEVICEMEGIADVGVVGEPDEMLGQIIKAVVVLKDGATIESKAIQHYCLQNLAQYKIPKIIEFAAELPKTGSGKLKRHLL